MKNWAGNLTYGTTNIHVPNTVEDVQGIVRGSKSLRPLGSRHSFSGIADSTSQLISTHELKHSGSINKEEHSIIVGSGIRYGDVCESIHQAGFALENLASLPHISIAGACATATHGSGMGNGCLAAAVRSLTMVSADGAIVSLDQKDEIFPAAVVGLGALGVVVEMELHLQPNLDLAQIVFQNMPMAALENNFTEIMGSGYSVSLFTDWQNKTINQIWVKGTRSEISSLPPTLHGAARATHNTHPIDNHPPENCTEQMGVLGRWYDRLPHFKLEYTPSSGKELQSEYFLPIEHAYAAISAVEKLNAKIHPHLLISEVRTIAADQFWMSPFNQQPSVALHFTWKPHTAAVNKILRQIESALSPYRVRPHWGKIYTMAPKVLQNRIRELSKWKELVLDCDPAGKFRNTYLNNLIFAES